MKYSVKDIFKIGVGPSSSHTNGPMIIGNSFAKELKSNNKLKEVAKIKVELFGSLGATGIGHGTHRATVIGLMGYQTETIDIAQAYERFDNEVIKAKRLKILNEHEIDFTFKSDIEFKGETFLEYHSNAMTLHAFDAQGVEIHKKTYYSIGGGAVQSEDEIGEGKTKSTKKLRYHFDSANELLRICEENKIRICDVIMANENTMRPKEETKKYILKVWDVMRKTAQRGLETKGRLETTGIPRKAPALYEDLAGKDSFAMIDPLEVMDWVNLWAIAVNEENAAGGQVVTAPTNGAAGVIPSVMHYMNRFVNHNMRDQNEEMIIEFLLTAAAIGMLYKKNASISGADVGCQGEVGVACSMAAGALAHVMGGDVYQVENAAEIGMEHNLGLTCDPIMGLVQIPCIERNAMGALKAINSARMALKGDGTHVVSLDACIKTMYETGKDMMSKYKETSTGGLAVNVTEC